MDILIINGPNLNLLGKREKSIYGEQTFESFYEETLVKKYGKLSLSYFQSNHEGEILDKIHKVGFDINGIVLNAGAFTHTSVAIRDAIAAISAPVVEVHISNVHQREEFRHHSYISEVSKGVIVGFGLKGYELALESFLN
ncbi:MAG: type II 3-dehydroquinate dehydratase [Cyclobacteriaceae bacterium]